MMTYGKYIFITILAVLCFTACEKDQGQPVIESVEPSFGPSETLVTFKGQNLTNIEEMTFSDQVINFNTAYNSDNALLLRIATDIPLGDHVVTIKTKGGTATTNFRVTKEAPEIFRFNPPSADPGSTVSLQGKNFYEPVEVYFFDSVQAEILYLAPDSIDVIVPEGVEKGLITVIANGGLTRSPVSFFTTNTILVNDFDGNGLRAETEKWKFRGFVDQDATNAVHDINPTPIEGSFLKLSGTDSNNFEWIGGAENNSNDTDVFQTFGITTDINNTLIEMDVHNNGKEKTYLLLALVERDGSTNDFTTEVAVDWEGWGKVSLPLNRFQDLDGAPVDPSKIKTLKVHLTDKEGTGQALEANVDNIKFLEIL